MEEPTVDNIVITAPDGTVTRVDMSTLIPMNDPNCTHDWQMDDEIIGNMQAQTCKNCPLGRWVKHEDS